VNVLTCLTCGMAFGLGVGIGAWMMRPNSAYLRRRWEYDEEVKDLLERKVEALEEMAEVVRGATITISEAKKGGAK